MSERGERDEHHLLKANLKQLRLPTMGSEFEKLAREAAAENRTYAQFLLQLTELEVANRAANALERRIKQAGFPVHKDLDTFDFGAVPSVNKQQILELSRAGWIEARENVCLIGNSGNGKTHLATALGLGACRAGKRVGFFTAASLVTKLQEAQKAYQLDRLWKKLERLDLLILDELGYFTFTREGAELLFQVFGERHERGSVLLTSNMPFSEWGQVFQGERMTAALLDRLTHRCHIFEITETSYRFKEASKSTMAKRRQKPE